MADPDDPKKTDAPTPDDEDPVAKAKRLERERIMNIYKSPAKAVAEALGAHTLSRQISTANVREERIQALLDEVQGRAPPQMAQFLKQAGPIIVPLINVSIMIFNIVGPIYIFVGKAIYKFLMMLPWDLFKATMGLGLCFFGGGYCASIAACEAFAMSGWPVTKGHLIEVYNAAIAMDEAQKADDARDDDGDGVADVSTLTASQFVDRKIRVAAAAVQEPNKLAGAVGGLYTSWLSVQATLRIKFARTITLALSIASFVEYYVSKALVPILTPFVAKEFVHWLPTVLDTCTRGFFIYFAWKLQEVVSAVQSALRGGLMFSRNLLNYLNKHGVKHIGPFSLEHEHTYIDEALGYTVGAVGFFVQWNLAFGTPFPLNIFMLPLDLIEWYIRVSITTGGTPAV